MIEFDADQVLFCALKDRPSSVRGMPRLQASFPMLHRMNSVLDSEVQAWFVQSCIALAVLTENAATLNPDDPSTDSNDFNVTKFDYGMVFQANPGDKIEGLARTAPNRDLSTAAATLLRFVGLPLGLPLELVLLDWTKSNFSQSRAVMQQLSLNFGTLQALVIHKIMEPVYRWRINLAMETGELPRNNGWQKIEFVAPPFPMLDPEKESVAFGHQIDRALTTQSRMLKSLGFDREEMITERQEEIGDCMRRAAELEAQYGQRVPWEILYGMNANPAYNADAQQDEKALTTQAQPEEPDEALPV
jgi:capsid protein